MRDLASQGMPGIRRLAAICGDPPGFAVDEPRGELGTQPRPPPWLQPRRERPVPHAGRTPPDATRRTRPARSVPVSGEALPVLVILAVTRELFPSCAPASARQRFRGGYLSTSNDTLSICGVAGSMRRGTRRDAEALSP